MWVWSQQLHWACLTSQRGWNGESTMTLEAFSPIQKWPVKFQKWKLWRTPPLSIHFSKFWKKVMANYRQSWCYYTHWVLFPLCPKNIDWAVGPPPVIYAINPLGNTTQYVTMVIPYSILFWLQLEATFFVVHHTRSLHNRAHHEQFGSANGWF